MLPVSRRLFVSTTILLSATSWSRAEEPPSVNQADKVSLETSDKENDARKEAAKEKPAADLEGLWPSPKLRDLMLQRWAEEVSDEFELEEEKRDKVRKGTVERWSKFLEDNRSDIQPLMNEFLEMRLELQPPSKEQVQKWADRALPMFDRFRDQLKQGQDEFREMLPFMKRAKFELETMKFAAGMGFAESKLKQWQKGEFAESELWDEPSGDRRKRRAERRERREAEEKASEAKSTEEKPPEETDQIALEMKAWDDYVAEFIKTYGLDEGQRTTAISCLSELKERAMAHRDRRKEDILTLEAKIKTPSQTDEELGDLKKQLADVYGPIDDMFKDLRYRLEQIPTTAQRDSATHKTEGEKAKSG